MNPTLVFSLLATVAFAAPQVTTPTSGAAPPNLPAGLPALPSGFKWPAGFGAMPSGFPGNMMGGLLGGQPGAQPGGQINSPEALASSGTGKYGAVSTLFSLEIEDMRY